MHRTRLAAVTLALVTLASCSGGSEGTQAESRPTTRVTYPVPTDAEASAMVEAIDAIAPGFGRDPDSAMDNARNTCSAIIGGVSDESLLEGTEDQFVADGVKALSAQQAKQIIAAVRESAWCT